MSTPDIDGKPAVDGGVPASAWTIPRPVAAAMADLGDSLGAVGYGDLVSSFNPLAPSSSGWRRVRDSVDHGLRAVVDLFLFGASVAPDQLPDRVRDHLELLAGAGLLVFESPGTVRTAGVVIQLLSGNWMICQPPQANPQLYFGEDSLALLCRLRPGPARRALDLCSGTGLQALQCARHVERVTAVEARRRCGDGCAC